MYFLGTFLVYIKIYYTIDTMQDRMFYLYLFKYVSFESPGISLFC